MNTPSIDHPTLAAPGNNGCADHEEPARERTAGAARSFEPPNNVSPQAWLEARRELLREEKAFTRQRDALAARQRSLPWVKIEKPYRFESTRGPVSLADLFAGRRQLIVQHFMLGTGWGEGCKSCSFMLDHLAPALPHLAARDVSFVVVSHAPLGEILSFKTRMCWQVEWVSAHATDFNTDFQVSYSEEEIARGPVPYNYALQEVSSEELPGISVFARDNSGAVHHTYSTYGRGLECVMTTYPLLDLVPKGRDEAGLDYGMAWVRHHDRYDHAGAGG